MEIVSLQKCESYEYGEVKRAVDKSFEALGGIESFATSGQTVLLKVNLLNNFKIESATTTNPVLVEIVAKAFKDIGCEVIIGDSSAGFFNAGHMNNVYKVTGMTQAAEKSGARLNDNFDTYLVDFPEGRSAKSFEIIDVAQKADVIINMAKLKTHQFTMYTGCVKNLFGLIPGMQKVQKHSECRDVVKFMDLLIDINESVKDKVRLNMIDAVIGMEGNGPSAGDPRKIGCIVASKSPYAADLVGISLINGKLDDFPQVYTIKKRGITPSTLDDVQIVGESVESSKCVGFKLVKDDKLWCKEGNRSVFDILTPFKKSIAPHPYVSKRKCKGCQMCKQHCPNNAITMVDGKAHFDLDKCIRCFCCQELCPYHLIKVKRSLFYRIIKKL